MRKIIYVVLIVVCFWMSGCGSFDVNLKDWQIGFSIDSVSFGGDWTHYKNIGVNKLYVEIDMKQHHNTPVKLDMQMNYNDTKPKTVVPDGKYVLDGAGQWNDYSTLTIDSDFQKKNGNTINSVKKVSDDINLHNEYYYKLNLKYSADNNSVVDLNIKSDDGKWNLVPKGLNFSVNYEVVHDGTADGPKLNLIVMAEGYRADQMDDYRAYVADAFQDSSTFHYLDLSRDHIKNDFFDRYWNQIRVIRMDTISPQAGVDKKINEDNIQTILNFNTEGAWQGCDFSRIRHIMTMTKPCGLSYDKADAYIILVNDKTVWAYAWAYGFEIGYKYGQPIHPVIIQAPAGENTADTDFHDYVITNAIAHELGHALGRLQDEYTSSNIKGEIYYCSWFRNIDDDINNCKWQKLIDKGYGSGNANNNLIINTKGALYRPDKYYRPTYNSTMNGNSDLTSDGYQFGPVNTYHLTASFKIRTSGSNPYVTDLICTNNSDVFYEWSHYSIDDFEREWKISDFR